MRLQRCKKLIGQLTCGRVEQSPTNLAQFAPDRCMHRIGHTGLATLFDQFDLGTAGSHSGSATRALETHQTAFRRNHLGERERAIEPSPNRSKLDHHPRAPNGVRLVNDFFTARDAGLQNRCIVERVPNLDSLGFHDHCASQFHCVLNLRVSPDGHADQMINKLSHG